MGTEASGRHLAESSNSMPPLTFFGYGRTYKAVPSYTEAWKMVDDHITSLHCIMWMDWDVTENRNRYAAIEWAVGFLVKLGFVQPAEPLAPIKPGDIGDHPEWSDPGLYHQAKALPHPRRKSS